jgi:hypothetical protein
MLNRKTPLCRSGHLARGGGLRRTPMKRRRWRPAVPVDTSAEMTVRSGGVCEVALPGCTGRGRHPSHRITQKAGGRHGAAKVDHDRLSNVMHACPRCHDWIGAHPKAADELGLALREGDDPTVERVRYRGRWALLDNAGGVTYLHGQAAA